MANDTLQDQFERVKMQRDRFRQALEQAHGAFTKNWAIDFGMFERLAEEIDAETMTDKEAVMYLDPSAKAVVLDDDVVSIRAGGLIIAKGNTVREAWHNARYLRT